MAKTLRSRIAAVAVAAVGVSMLSAVPANAATTSVSIVEVSGVTRATTTTTAYIDVKQTGDSNQSGRFVAQATAVPTGAGLEVGDKFFVSNGDVDSGETFSIDLGRTNPTAGLYGRVVAEGDDTTTCTSVAQLLAAANQANGTSDGEPLLSEIAFRADGRAYTWDSDDNDGTSGGSAVWVLIVGTTYAYDNAYDSAVSGACNLSGTSGIGQDTPTYTTGEELTLSNVVGSPKAYTRTYSSTNDYLTVAGAYSFTVWFETDGDNVFEADEKSTTTSVTISGTPTAMNVTPNSSTLAVEQYGLFSVALKDAGGRTTKLINSEQVVIKGTVSAGTAAIEFYEEQTRDGGNPFTLTSAYDLFVDNEGEETDHYLFEVYPDAVGTFVITADFRGSLAPLSVVASSGTISVRSLGNVTAASVADRAGLSNSNTEFEFPGTISAADTSEDIYVSRATPLSLTYNVVGAALSTIKVEYYSEGTAPAGIFADGNYWTEKYISTDASGKASLTIAPTSAAEGDSYLVRFVGANRTLTYYVQFETPEVSPDGITVAEIPTGVTKALVAVGGTASYTATVKDQFGTPYHNYQVKLTTSSLSRNASKTVTATTSATGTATVALTDASTSTTVTTDSVSIKVYAPSNLDTAVQTFSITHKYAATAGTLTLTGGTTATTTCEVYVGADASDADEASCSLGDNKQESAVDVGHKLLDANEVDVKGYAATFTGSEGIVFVTDENDMYEGGLAKLVVANDNETPVYAIASKAGLNTVTVSLGGNTKTITFMAYSDASFARSVTLAGAATGNAGKAVQYTATVKDGFGNTVPGVAVNFTVNPSMEISGYVTPYWVTDLNGKATIAVTGAAAGTIGVMAAITGAQSAAAADDPVTGWAKGSAKSATVTTTLGAAIPDANLEAVKAQVATLATTITSIQTAISTLVASTTATLTALSAKINKIMKKLKI